MKLLAPLIADADPAHLRTLARELRREADEIEARAKRIEADAREREDRARRHHRRQEALQELRDIHAAGGEPSAHIARVAAKHDLTPEQLAVGFSVDKRRQTAAERAERDREIARLARLGHSNKLIAAELGVSTATVERALRRVKEESARNPSLRLRQKDARRAARAELVRRRTDGTEERPDR